MATSTSRRAKTKKPIPARRKPAKRSCVAKGTAKVSGAKRHCADAPPVTKPTAARPKKTKPSKDIRKKVASAAAPPTTAPVRKPPVAAPPAGAAAIAPPAVQAGPAVGPPAPHVAEPREPIPAPPQEPTPAPQEPDPQPAPQDPSPPPEVSTVPSGGTAPPVELPEPPVSLEPPDVPAAEPVTVPPPVDVPSDGPVAASPAAKLPVYTGVFGRAQAERLLWRAGFGPSPGWVDALVEVGLAGAVSMLTRPHGEAALVGPAPDDGKGNALYPASYYGHDHLWWLDRMVRTDQPFVERMALIWHDWFATAALEAQYKPYVLEQNELFRTGGRGSFAELLDGVTGGPAMLMWLNAVDSQKGKVNENHARELMELFTLGSGNGYTEDDVREAARAMTGWVRQYTIGSGHSYRVDPNRHVTGNKTIFGSTGDYDWQDVARLCVGHPAHATFFVTKLWSYFIPVPPSDADRRMLEFVYVGGGHEILPVVEAILMHPTLHAGPDMIKNPTVYAAGLLRAKPQAISGNSWFYFAQLAGQQLFAPPDVSGWDDDAWLDTGAVRARWNAVNTVVQPYAYGGTAAAAYPATETPEEALTAAREFWGDPGLTDVTCDALLHFSRTCLPVGMNAAQKRTFRAQRQNALRQLIGIAPDHLWS